MAFIILDGNSSYLHHFSFVAVESKARKSDRQMDIGLVNRHFLMLIVVESSNFEHK
jgi:hypothetical protein